MTPVKRVVFDTSSLIGAALRPDSTPKKAFLYAVRYCQVYASVETLVELATVLERSKFDRYISLEAREEFVSLMRDRAILLDVLDCFPAELSPSCRDAKDNKFLALALAAEADVMVSSDKDLLALHPWRGIRIVTPAEFVSLP